jgi:HK97 family phage major capsid protein
MKVLRHTMNPRKYPLDGLELEVHQEMEKERADNGHRTASGINVPMNLAINTEAAQRYATAHGLARRDVSTATSVSTVTGGATIPTILSTSMIELFRARMITRQMGARIMTGMQGNFAIPRQITTTTFYMVAEGANVTASNPTLDQVPFTPKTGGVYTTYTRRFLEQSNLDAEQFIREDQAQVVARGVETAALNGQMANGYPMGILQNPLVPVVAGGTNGAAPTWENIVALESAVAVANADVGSMGYIMDAATRGTLKTTAKIGSTFPIYLWNSESSEPLNGYPVGITNLLPLLSKGSASGTLHAIIFGNWSELIYAFWSGLDVIVDPYTQAASGSVNIVTLQDFDVNIRHPASFAALIDVISNQVAAA